MYIFHAQDKEFIVHNFGKPQTTPKIYAIKVTRIKQTKIESYWMDGPIKPYYAQLVGDLLVHIGVLTSLQWILPRQEDHYCPKKCDTTVPFVANEYPWKCGVLYSF